MTDNELIVSALCDLSPEAISYMFPGLSPDSVLSKASPDHGKERRVKHSAPPKRSKPLVLRSIISRLDFDKSAAKRDEKEDDDYLHRSSTSSFQPYVCPSIVGGDSENFLLTEEGRTDDWEEIESRIDERKAEQIRRAVREIQERYGITIEEFEMILSYTPKPSRLEITRAGKITLPDFEGKEVKMDTLAKVVYILFLRHPEGIEFKNMPDHRAEMLDIYCSLSNRFDTASFEGSIDRLCNTVENNSLNEKVSRIKRAFLNVVDERIAQFYYIKGPAGGLRKIDLDRTLVKVS